MAVYKPSNCRPFLNSVDLTKDQYLQCELNTSNVKITGYKVKVFDDANEVIFESGHYDRPTGNQQVNNGSVLVVPLLIMDKAEEQGKRWTQVGWNTIYGVKTEAGQCTYYYRIAEGASFRESVNAQRLSAFENLNTANDYFNQPFKWEIVVAQGQNAEGEVEDYSFDVLVTTGQILGSNATRIQANLSDEIYKDYYIQLTGGNLKVPRVRISSYDRTFGYIYPQEGFLTNRDVENATGFYIYKDTNNPEYVTAARAVDYAIAKNVKDLAWSTAFGSSDITVGALRATANQYYFEMRVGNVTRAQYKNFNSNGVNLRSLFNGRAPDTVIAFNSTRFLFLAQEGTTTDEYERGTNSALNGVWVLIGAADFETSNGAGDSAIGTCSIRWQRPSGANTWANYIGRNWFVRNGILGLDIAGSDEAAANAAAAAQNIGSNAKEGMGGLLNQTPIGFFPEEPVVIYPSDGDDGPKDAKGVAMDADNMGVVFHNTVDRIYLKPFVGLANGMRIRWGGDDNKAQFFDISNLDTNYYYCTPINVSDSEIFNAKVSSGITGTPYRVYSYFKTSDENPFYGRSEPTLSISFNPAVENVDVYPFVGKLNSRSLDVTGTYEQAQHTSWKYFRWTLIDLTIDSTIQTEATYRGDIAYHFDGLQDGHRYLIILTVEDEMGYVQELEKNFEVTLENLGSGETFPLEVSLDCDTHSIDINFTRNGAIIPYYWDDEAKDHGMPPGYVYNGESVQIPDDETLSYEKVQLVDPTTQGLPIAVDLTGPESNNVTFNIQHSHINRHFVGELSDVEIQLNEGERIRMGVLVPTVTLVEKNGDTIPNPLRNQMLLNYWAEALVQVNWVFESGSLISVPIYFSGVEGLNQELADGDSLYWRQPLPVVCAYQNPAEIDQIGEFDYLPISYFNPDDEDQYRDSTAEEKEQGAADKTGLQVTNGDDANYRYYYFMPGEYNCTKTIIPSPIGLDKKTFVNYAVKDGAVPEGKSSYRVFENDTREIKIPYAVRNTGYLTLWCDDEHYNATQINGAQGNVKAKEIVTGRDGQIIIAPDFIKRKWSDMGLVATWNDKRMQEEGALWKTVDINDYAPYRTYMVENQDDSEQSYPYCVVGEESETLEYMVHSEVGENHDGRQDIAKLLLTFHIMAKNFDTAGTDIFRLTEIRGLCYIKEEQDNGRE